jgi:transcriptional regulator with XRE-family HTH domain
MSHLGQKIKDARKQKGLSQEELADTAKVSLRTIQRIETNKNEPRGKTLHLICTALKLNIEDLAVYGKEEDKTYHIALHLSVLSVIILPLGNIILPLILWMPKKNKIIGLHKVGATILNFQIIWSLITFGVIMLATLFKIMHYSDSSMLFYIVILLYSLNCSLAIGSAIKLRSGRNRSLYPSLIKFIK